MEYYDLLNELAKHQRVKNATVSAYVINEVSPRSFLRESTRVSSESKVVQVRVCSISVDGKDYFLEAWVYACVPKFVQVGEFCFLTGTLTNLSQESYSKEVTLFNYAKENGSWVIVPCKVTPWVSSPVKDDMVKKNLEYWKQFPYTLSSGKDTIITPITRMVETEVLMDFNNGLVGNTFEFPRVFLGDVADLTKLQADCLEEMLLSPVLQVQVENENLISVENLVRTMKSMGGVSTVVYDLRTNRVKPEAVVAQLKYKGEIKQDGKRYVLLVPAVTHGIPSIVLGTECLF